MFAMRTKRTTRRRSSSNTTAREVQVAPRQTTLDATTWWIVDLNGNEEEEARTQHGGGGATPLVRRCMRVHGWTETQTRRVLKGYRQFLRIKAKLEDWTAEQLAPSASVGLMWQQHILDANNYFHDCMLLCGHVVGHDPDSVLLSDEDKMLRREATVNALLEYYNERDVDTVCVWRDIFHPEEKPTKTGGTTLETQESSSSEGTDYTTRTRGDLVCSDEQDLAGSWDLVDSADCCAVEDRNASTFEGSRSSALVCHTLSTVTYPTNVEVEAVDSEAVEQKRRHIDLALDQCESMRLPCKKKLMLNNLSLTAFDIPLRDLCGTSLGDSLRKLSLAGNPLGSISTKLVCSLPALKILDLSQCELTRLPDKWNLPQLTRLNLSHNRLTEFPEESMLAGLPELLELNMYGNKVAEIVVPGKAGIMSKLQKLNLGYNDLVYLPDDLDRWKSLRILKVSNNFLAKVPMRVCDMELKQLDASCNPVTAPPFETCERGLCSMRRYWHCLRLEEEQSKAKRRQTWSSPASATIMQQHNVV